MCGINGFTFQDEDLVERMNNVIFHRGPDSKGSFSDSNVTLGHRRLKVIDLSENASQPMCDSSNAVWIVFNGEVYNFKELKKELEEKGHRFKSRSDTEVVLYSYLEWGYDAVRRFNGMWAFAIYDSREGKLFFSRDKLGKKPLFYTQSGKNLIFSSEIRPLFLHNIKKELNKASVSSFLSYRYVLGEETMFKRVYKLLPAHNMVFDIKKGEVEKIWEYWDVDKSDLSISEEDAKREVERLLKDAVSLRQISDVPIGSINSGGLDSSLISAIMSRINKEPIRTFTVKFPEEGYDETPFARLLADYCKTKHKEITIDTQNFLGVMREYSRKKDEPIGVPNEIALYLLFREIKKSVTVILSGEGADEIFAGYNRIFRGPHDFRRLKEIESMGRDYQKELPSLYSKYGGRFFSDELDHFIFMYDYFPPEEKDLLLKEDAKMNLRPLFRRYFERIDGSYEKRISYVFLKIHLPGLLSRLDNPSMFSAVEARCPFLDPRLVNLAFNLSFEFKNPWKSERDRKDAESKNCDEIADIHDVPKYILKKVSEGYVPREIISRKKQGFPLPLQKWFTGEFLERAREILLSRESKIGVVIDKDNLVKWIERGVDKKSEAFDEKSFGQRLWMLVSLELWLREWF